MTKLKLNFAQEAGEILTREELKKILGGTEGSGSGSDVYVKCNVIGTAYCHNDVWDKKCKKSNGKDGKCLSPQATTICVCS